ncbi:hypothetical protein P1P75_17660 [Streptomyces sp. ID05-39B]|uniref:hypothetical protein n=1 Tax=Streptomyces sp. ID05-39B TaxID=3028664 RepID=UPI0029A430B8|nr:hypothetical protein [Streptomyces sp. ID05-39B]MDX3528214.1 hypothetical protein [Streptomyces sp. ID05-39B]
MTDFPGPNPMHGDTVELMASTFVATITGKITSRGVLVDGRGFVELVLPDGDPQQRRDLERAGRYQYRLYDGGTLLYSSPDLQVRETRRESDGALVVMGSP